MWDKESFQQITNLHTGWCLPLKNVGEQLHQNRSIGYLPFICCCCCCCCCCCFPIQLGFCHHPNWRTHIFQRGGPGPPTRYVVVMARKSPGPKHQHHVRSIDVQRLLYGRRSTAPPPHTGSKGSKFQEKLRIQVRFPWKIWGMEMLATKTHFFVQVIDVYRNRLVLK